MSTLSSRQQHYDEIRKLLAFLSTDEQLRLISEISTNLHKRLATPLPEKRTPVPHPHMVKGKYAHVQTSSERFAQRKREEIG